ncbi:MAG: hypothetical protein AB1486_20300 [Planctomycetota bacterium]
MLDLSDIVDPKVGYGPTIAGIKVEVTEYTGLGLALGEAWGFEFFGRRVRGFAPFFGHLGVIGFEGLEHEVDSYFLGVRLSHSDHPRREPPLIDRCRVGIEGGIIGWLGLYVNLGEILDFLAGPATLDPADDDGLPKGWELGRARPSEEPKEEGGANEEPGEAPK